MKLVAVAFAPASFTIAFPRRSTSITNGLSLMVSYALLYAARTEGVVAFTEIFANGESEMANPGRLTFVLSEFENPPEKRTLDEMDSGGFSKAIGSHTTDHNLNGERDLQSIADSRVQARTYIQYGD